MISLDTEVRLSKLFLCISEGENSVETARLILADQLNFDPYLCFRALDRESKGFIDYVDIIDFLKYS